MTYGEANEQIPDASNLTESGNIDGFVTLVMCFDSAAREENSGNKPDDDTVLGTEATNAFEEIMKWVQSVEEHAH